MPCRDYPTPDELREDNIRREERRIADLATAVLIPTAKLKKVEAILCAIMSQLEVHYRMGTIYDFLNHCNWLEAGVTIDEATTWWDNHKREDKKRRLAEAEKEAAKKFSQFLESLSEDERAVITNRLKTTA